MKKRSKKNKKFKNNSFFKIFDKSFFALVFLIVTIISIFTFIGFPYINENVLLVLKDRQDVVIKKPVDYQLKLFMVGDALIHSSVYEDAKVGSGYDFKPMLEYIKSISSKYDLAYYNQETILGGADLGYSNYPRFNSPTEVGDAFIDAGFNLVSLANNHTMDKGERGVLHSVNYWNNKKDVVTSGQWSSLEERDKIRIYEKNNIKYAFFSYTTWTNGLNTPSGKDYLNNVYTDDKASWDISRVRDDVDVVIVAMHWGNEYSFNVSSSQSHIANHLSSLGVDLIIGTHSHVVQPVEYINDGKTLVIYSLGNVISDQVGIERLTGLMMEVTINKHVDVDDSSVTKVINPKAELIYTKSYRSYDRQFKVYPYPMLNDGLLYNYGTYYERYKSVVNSKYSGISWGITGE